MFPRTFFCGRFDLLRIQEMMQPVMTATAGSPDGFGSALGITVADFLSLVSWGLYNRTM